MWMAAVLLAGATVSSFAWGALFYFRLAFAHEVRKRWLIGSSLTCMGIISYTVATCPPPHPAFVATAIAILAIGLTVFWGAVRAHGQDHPTNAFVRTSPHTLVRGGPYHFIRHPFYMSYLSFHVAAACLTCSWLVLLTVGWMGMFYYTAAREEETSFRNSSLGQQYVHYVALTGMFLPRVWPARQRADSGSMVSARRDAA